MSWRFWRPKHTMESVAQRLASGLLDGSIALDEPLADEPFEDELDADAIVVQIDVSDSMSDEQILDKVKECAHDADAKNRDQGGAGLRIGQVVIASPKVKVALWPKSGPEHACAR
jgi:hypothetical protein